MMRTYETRRGVDGLDFGGNCRAGVITGPSPGDLTCERARVAVTVGVCCLLSGSGRSRAIPDGDPGGCLKSLAVGKVTSLELLDELWPAPTETLHDEPGGVRFMDSKSDDVR